MRDEGTSGNGLAVEEARTVEGSGIGAAAAATAERPGGGGSPPPAPPVVTIVISQSERCAAASAEKAKKGYLPRSESCHDECRICQQQTEEPLLDLGCSCRGELAKAHQSCIEAWFRTRGSNKCEICQQFAENVPFLAPQPRTNYWGWRVDTGHGGHDFERAQREQGCFSGFSPIWVAFAILVGGLLLDVLISVSLGVSALPVNIIIGVLVLLGLGTALRLAFECCQCPGSSWWRLGSQRADAAVN